jgi:protein-L-isoaspartate(D-aspartate) O-methyltransferase
LKDTNKHKGLRNQLAKILEEKGIIDKNVLNAIRTIPRHLFLNSSFEDFAYQDKAFPIGAGQTISQPYTVAYQSQLLDVKKDQKILEIGTGSGYQTAVLCLLGAKVYSVERQNELFKTENEYASDIENCIEDMIYTMAKSDFIDVSSIISDSNI